MIYYMQQLCWTKDSVEGKILDVSIELDRFDNLADSLPQYSDNTMLIQLSRYRTVVDALA